MVFGLFKKKKLLKAIKDGEVDEVATLLENFDKINETFARPDRKSTTNWSYLLHACKFGNKKIVELVLEKGAALNNQDSDGKPPIYWAACNDHEEEAAKTCTLLIDKGVDFDSQSKEGRTALFGAIIKCNDKALEVLLKAGADPNLQSEDGNSPLNLAVTISAEAVKLLLEHNADPNIENLNKGTPIFEVGYQDNIEVVIALIEAGADINREVETPEGVKVFPLDVAVGEDNQLVAMYLYENGAKHNPDISNLEVMLHANEEQASFHKELGAEGKYHYEFHMKDLNDNQIAHMKSQFDQYTWDMGFAVTKFKFKEDGNIFKIAFDSKKYFNADEDEWGDQDLAQNIVTRILGKEQFICSALWSTDYGFEEKDIIFIDDQKNKWKVEISKYGGLLKMATKKKAKKAKKKTKKKAKKAKKAKKRRR